MNCEITKNIDKNITLYAQWGANEYKVTANATGGTIDTTEGWTGSGTSATKMVTFDAEYGLLPIPTRTGYSFIGWASQKYDNVDRFDKKKCDHDHLVCQKCGKLKDVFLNGIADEIKNNSGDDIISYELNAYYICDSCK